MPYKDKKKEKNTVKSIIKKTRKEHGKKRKTIKSPNSIYMRNYRKKQKALAVDYKGGKCEKCGFIGHIAAMDFHHPDNDGWKLTNQSFTSSKDKLDDLTLLCSNCHRIIHTI